MATNIVIKVDDNFNPLHDNVLVYNAKTKIWEAQSKEVILSEVNKEFKKNNEERTKILNEIKTLNSKISKLAEIMKGELV